MSLTLLQQIMEANRSYLSGSARYLDSTGDPFVVIACIDSRLTGLIEPALGLPRHRAAVIRTAGNRVSEADVDLLRSLAVAVFLKGAREIFVTGHTDCALSKFSAAEVIESFRKAGVPRSAFGPEDLRTWFGAFPGIKANVLQGVDFLRRSALMPRDVKIHGLIIGIERGEAELVFDGDAAAPAGSAATVEITEPVSTPQQKGTAPTKPAAEPPAPAAVAQGHPIIIAKAVRGREGTARTGQPASMLDAVLTLRDFIEGERKKAGFHKTMVEIQTLLNNERDPVRLVSELDRIAGRYKSQYPALPAALEYLKNSVRTRSTAGLGFEELFKRIVE